MRIYQVIMIIISILIIASVGSYCFTSAIDSDMVEGLFWAEEAVKSGSLLSTEFAYSYAIPFGSNLLLIPFIRVFGMTQLANSLGMLCFFLMMVVVSVMFLKQLNIETGKALAGTALEMLAFRTQIGVNLLHHVLYYQLGFICFLGCMGSILPFLRSDKVGKKWYYILLFFSIWNGANGVPSVALAGIPVLFALIIMTLQRKISLRATGKVTIILLAGILLGYAIYLLSLRGVHETTYLEETGAYVINSTDRWIKHLGKR